MAVGIAAGSQVWILSHPDLLNAFFSTVAVRLEGGDWGSRFPFVMNGLASDDGLTADQVEPAGLELNEIFDELEKLPVSDLVWDADDASAAPPWGDDVWHGITRLDEYFTTSDNGDSYFARLVLAIDHAYSAHQPLRIYPHA